MADDGLREIQLRGKHLVSLFMAGAVLLVATFLCGVLVGRGVRAQKEPALAPASAVPGAVAEDPTAPLVPLQPLTKTTPATPAATPAATPPPPTEEDLSYYSRLEGKSASPASVKPVTGAARAETPTRPAEATPRQAAAPAATTPAPKPAVKASASPAPPLKTPAPPPQKAASVSAQKSAAAAKAAESADPAGSGYVVKIVAYRDKAQSEALVSRLVKKGYAAYVVTVSGKGAPLYSVRVGKFKARADADAAKRRLEKEEQFKPLITR